MDHQLYHIYAAENHASIVAEGLYGTDWVANFDAWGLPASPAALSDADLPAEPADWFEVGRAIVEAVFEDERPADCPARTNTVFCYADRAHAADYVDDDYNVACVDPAAVDVSFSAANNEWKTHVMRRTIACVRGDRVHITESQLRTAATTYWDSARPWPLAPDDQPPHQIEVFGPTHIDPVALTCIEDATTLRSARPEG